MSKALKLIFLSGMDGTGKLFEGVISHLNDFDCEVITYSTTTAQDYQTLTNQVKNQLPDQDFVLIAESFSGPIAAELAKDNVAKGLKAIIFVATFLSPPNRFLLATSRIFPLKFMSKLPGSKFIQQKLFFGEYATNKILNLFNETVNGITTRTLKERIKAMQYVKFESSTIDVSAAYLLPLSDRLVPKAKAREFQNYFSNIEILEMDGPHFILQAKPKESANLICNFLDSLNQRGQSR